MNTLFAIKLTNEKVISILEAFIQGVISYDELKTWAVLVMNARDRDGFLEYNETLGDIVFAIEMSEDHDPITSGMARDFIQDLHEKHEDPLCS
jgi:hypothetical protein